MTGSSHKHKSEYENETCDVCKKNQKFTAMQCGPERHSSFHDDLMGFLPGRPKPKGEKPQLRHRQECRGKPRHEPPNMQFEVDSANNFLDERDVELPKATITKPGADGSIKASNFKSKALYCEVKLTELLGKTGSRVRPVTPGKYEDAPDSYRTSVCCLGAAAG